MSKTWKPYLEKRLSKAREYQYDNLKITIAPGVFHPGYFYSTNYLLQYILKLELKNKRLLEMGCGSGLISLVAAQKGSTVTATDLSTAAVNALELNAKKNNIKLEILHSDLFAAITARQFDLIALNPPYYRGKPLNEKNLAWYCGEEFEYFFRFFSEVKSFMNNGTKIVMVLSDGCDLDKIKKLCTDCGLKIELMEKHKFLLETEFIFQISQ